MTLWTNVELSQFYWGKNAIALVRLHQLFLTGATLLEIYIMKKVWSL